MPIRRSGPVRSGRRCDVMYGMVFVANEVTDDRVLSELLPNKFISIHFAENAIPEEIFGSGKKRLTEETMSQNLRTMEYAVRGM